MIEQEISGSSKVRTAPGLERLVPWALALVTAIVYWVSNPKPNVHFDYTWRIALALLHGQLGLTEQPPSWLNEMVPIDGKFYSVFPLGAVLSVMPFAVLKLAHLIQDFPAAGIAALIAGFTAFFFFQIANRYDLDLSKKIMLALFPVFGSWMWANLAFAGAWQISLGFAVVGQAAAIYFLLVRRYTIVAGLCFAIAFGNRAEVIVVLPIMLYLLLRETGISAQGIKAEWRNIAKFCAVPLLLGIATMAYNEARFGSPFDFGYARIPAIQTEPWFKDGLFTVKAIPANAWQMLFETWKEIPDYPYLVPKGFGGSIFLACPFLFLIFTRSYRDKALRIAAWTAIGLLTAVLWTHANTGGWQFAYRYAMILLPWLALVLLEGSPSKTRPVEIVLFALSVAINAWGTYLFLWTDFVPR